MHRIHWVAGLAITASIALSMLTAYLFYATQDEALPYGANASFTITEVPSGLSKDAILAAISTEASRVHENIYKVVPDPSKVGAGRLLYAFVGNPQLQNDLYGGGVYPSFSKSFATTVLPYSAIVDQDIRGLYVTSADTAHALQILAALQSQGIASSLETAPVNFVAIRTLSATTIGWTIVAMSLALLLALAYSTTNERKTYTVKALNGYSAGRVLFQEIASTSAFFVIVSIAASAAMAIILALYNSLNQIVGFAVTTVSALAICYVAVIGIQATSFLLLPSAAPSELLQGRKPAAVLAVVSVVVQAVVLGMIFAVLSAGLQLYDSTITDAANTSKWEQSKDVVSVRFAGSNTQDDFAALTDDFGLMFRTEEAAGNGILAVHPPAGQPNQITGPGIDSIIVNNPYLARQRLLDVEGNEISELPEKPGVIYVLIPEEFKAEARSIADNFRGFAEFQQTLQLSVPSETVAVQTIFTLDGQTMFNYGSTDSMEHTSQRDSVLAVIPAAAAVLSDDFYLAAGTTGNALFADASAAASALRGSDLESHVLSVDRVSDYALADLNDRDARMRTSVANIALIALVLLLSTAVLASIYADRSKQALFAKQTHGWSYFRMHGAYLSTAAGLGTVVLLTCSVFGLVFGGAYWASVIAIALNVGATSILIRVYQKRSSGDFVRRN